MKLIEAREIIERAAPTIADEGGSQRILNAYAFSLVV
jgi:hypothetical protein